MDRLVVFRGDCGSAGQRGPAFPESVPASGVSGTEAGTDLGIAGPALASTAAIATETTSRSTFRLPRF